MLQIHCCKNWYKIAQNKPESLDSLSEVNTKAWIDPQGVVYPIQSKMTHGKWMQNNFGFLRENYNYSHTGLKSGWTPVENLVAHGWMRFLPTGFGFNFLIDNFSNISQLKEIEDYLFSVLKYDYDSYKYIVIMSLERKGVEFEWRDFIESGENFIDFVRKNIN
jgi:hypothetical protein